MKHLSYGMGDSTIDDEIYLANIDYPKADEDKNRMNIMKMAKRIEINLLSTTI